MGGTFISLILSSTSMLYYFSVSHFFPVSPFFLVSVSQFFSFLACLHIINVNDHHDDDNDNDNDNDNVPNMTGGRTQTISLFSPSPLLHS